MSVAATILRVRRSLGMNQSQLAKAVWPDRDPAITQTYISRYERGVTDPPATIYERIQDLEFDHGNT